MHHERAQRVTHSLEALDEGSGTETRAARAPTSDYLSKLRGGEHDLLPHTSRVLF